MLVPTTFGFYFKTAQVAERIEREARRRWFDTTLTYMVQTHAHILTPHHTHTHASAQDAYDKRGLPAEKLVIFICSTCGQGDTPENMKQLWRFLRRKDLPPNSLDGLNFAVFGLGDSGYPIYNAVARRLNQVWRLVCTQRHCYLAYHP